MAALLAVLVLAGCGTPTDTTPQSAPLGAASGTTTSPGPSAAPSASPASTPDAADGEPTGAPSRFERDPAVRVLRLHYRGSAIGVNRKSMRNADLLSSSTPKRLALLPKIFRREYGDRYPGPIPFTPVEVRRRTATFRDVKICVLGDGWLLDARTGRPTKPRDVVPLQAWVIRTARGWRVDGVWDDSFSCSDVAIPEVKF